MSSEVNDNASDGVQGDAKIDKTRKRKRELSSPNNTSVLLSPVAALSSSTSTKRRAAPKPKKITKKQLQLALKQRKHCIDELVSSLVGGTFQKVVFLVGAGISVNAGIPDFRSPKSGLYAQVKRMGLPHPEDIFTLDCFLDDPRAFYSIAKEFFTYTAHPTAAHRFMKTFETRRLLHMVYTQNIDGLEVDVGIAEKKLVQAHGHMRSAHCCKCKKDFAIDLFFEAARNDAILYCDTCNDSSKGIVKPHIIFFGEKLPRTFSTRLEKINEADLVFVMGTSMKVKPFSTLLNSLPETTPIVVINRDLPASCSSQETRRKIVFLDGDIEETVSELTAKLHW